MDNKTQTNKITRSPDSNTPESTWEYKITNKITIINIYVKKKITNCKKKIID